MSVPPSAEAQRSSKRTEAKESVVIRFAGDSGDGMQLTGMQFTTESALAGNDIGTLPDFPAEIRAPAGTLAGVSAFQVNFASREVFTPGDDVDVLVAMNPAALKTNLGDLKSGGILMVNTEAFSEQNLNRAGYAKNPLEDGSLDRYQLVQVDITKLTVNALQDLGLSNREALRCKNFFALGLLSWLFHRPIESTEHWIEGKFKKNPELVEANLRALRAGYNFGGDRRAVRGVLRGEAGGHRARDSTATSPATPRPRSASWRRPARPGCRCFSAAIRSRRRATCSTSSPRSSSSTCAPSRPRTRSRASGRRSERRSAAPSASPARAVPAWT